MVLDNEKDKWFKIGDVASRLNVGNHVIRHYTDKLEGVFGLNVRVDPTNNFTMYNSEAIKILANVRKMVQDDHMNLSEVHKELTKVGQGNLPAKFELDAAESFVYIKNVIEVQQEQIGQLVKAFGLLTEKLEGFEQLPSVIKSYQDDVSGVFAQLSHMEQDISTVNELKSKLFEYEQENLQIKQLCMELKDRADRTDSLVIQEVAGSVKSIIDDNKKLWTNLAIPAKTTDSVKRKWWKIFG